MIAISSRLRVFAAAILLAPALWASPAWADRKVALVVGNAAYADAPLRNPVNDARAMASSLRRLGFDVTLKENATKAQMDDLAADFGEKLREGDTALFFFAGHGIQVQGRNYLVPVDARLASEHRVRAETFDVDGVLDQMAAAKAKVSLVILDACRNNPFERRFRSASGGGLAALNAPEGTLIAYATAPGRVAADGEGENGLYTRELLRALEEPGLKVEEVFKRVRVGVAAASNGLQVPWEASSLTGDFFFRPRSTRTTAPIAAVDVDDLLWSSVREARNPAELTVYLERFPEGRHAAEARARLAALNSAPTASAATDRAVDASPQRATQIAQTPAASAVAKIADGVYRAYSPAGTLTSQPEQVFVRLENGHFRLSAGFISQNRVGGTTCTGDGPVEVDGSLGPMGVVCGAPGRSPREFTLTGRIVQAGTSRTIRTTLHDEANDRRLELEFR